MKQSTPSAAAPRHKLAVLTWIGIYQTTTFALFVIGPALSTLPLPLGTLVLTAIVVPTMVYVVLLVLKHLFAPWLASDASDLESSEPCPKANARSIINKVAATY